MMVRWMCGVSLKDRRRSEDLCNLLGINCNNNNNNINYNEYD